MKKWFIVLISVALLASCSTTKVLPTQSANTTYRIGDVYNQNGVKGIVVDVDNTGKHGIIMSIGSSDARWIASNDLKFETTSFYEDDGAKNMEVIAKYIKDNNKSWADFPLFNWARSLGEGWYIPSKEEALKIWKNINGGTMTYNKSTFKKFDENQRRYGGDNLVDTRFYIGSKQPWYWYTSTEAEEGNVYSVQFKQDFKSQLIVGFSATIDAFPAVKKPAFGNLYKSRAIYKF